MLRQATPPFAGTQFGRKIWWDWGPVLLVIFFLNILQWATGRLCEAEKGGFRLGPWLPTAAGSSGSGFPEIVMWSHEVPRVHVSLSFGVDSVHLNFSLVLLALITGLVPSLAPSPPPPLPSPFSLFARSLIRPVLSSGLATSYSSFSWHTIPRLCSLCPWALSLTWLASARIEKASTAQYPFLIVASPTLVPSGMASDLSL